MPSSESDEARHLRKLIWGWIEDVDHLVDDIGAWREAAAKRPDDPQSRWPAEPDRFMSRTSQLLSQIRQHYPAIDVTPIEDVFEAIVQWTRFHDPVSLPMQAELVSRSERAVMVLHSVDDAIRQGPGDNNRENRKPPAEPSGIVEVEYVTLSQIAWFVKKHKRTVERWREDFPAPANPGGGGRTAEWRWADVRSIVEGKSGRIMPLHFPGAAVA